MHPSFVRPISSILLPSTLFPLPSSLYLLVSHSPCSPIDCALTSSCPFHSFHSLHVHSSLGFSVSLLLSLSFSIHLFPRYECGLGEGWWGMRHTFKCQLPATANGFLLPARSATVPLPFSRSFSLLLSITRSFFFVLFSICHTHRASPLPFPTPCNCSTIFFSKLASITGGKRRKRVQVEKGMWADCVCVLGGTPRG